MPEKIWWPDDDSAVWLTEVDGRLGILLLNFLRDSSRDEELRFLEVGVWKGGWSSVILKNVPGSRGYGIDPFPGRVDFIDKLSHRFRQLELENSFNLFPDWNNFEQNYSAKALLSAIHIDGEHTEAGVEQDLTMASKYLAERGIIVLDDYRHFWFPGIASAMHRFLNHSDFSILATTANKAYLVREQLREEMQDYVLSQGDKKLGVPVWNFWREWDQSHLEYPQRPDVGGKGVLLVSEYPKKRHPSKSRLHTWLIDWTPPALKRHMAKMYSRKRKI